MSGRVSRKMLRRVSVAFVLGALAAATGCVSISPRVWQNGQAMTSSWQYHEVMAGSRSPSALRGVYYGSDAHLLGQRSARYPYFGHW